MERFDLAKKNGYILYQDSEGYDIRHDGTVVSYSFFINFELSENKKGLFKIASTSHGLLSEKELQELIKSYQAALDTVEFFKEVLGDNTDITF